MRAFHDTDSEAYWSERQVRPHPWGATLYGKAPELYIDLKASPHLAEQAAVDFALLKGTDAHERFLELLRWVNSPASLFESNDCALLTSESGGLQPHQQPPWTGTQRVACGRLMFLQRSLDGNRDVLVCEKLLNAILCALQEQPDVELVEIGVSRVPTFYRELAKDDDDLEAFGEQLEIEWWVAGLTDADVAARLSSAFACIRVALERASAALPSILGTAP